MCRYSREASTGPRVPGLIGKLINGVLPDGIAFGIRRFDPLRTRRIVRVELDISSELPFSTGLQVATEYFVACPRQDPVVEVASLDV